MKPRMASDLVGPATLAIRSWKGWRDVSIRMGIICSTVGIFSLAACATWPAGDDPKGKELKAQTTPVLAALVKYREDRGEYPSSLYELVPKYLSEVPFAADLDLVRDKKHVEFNYSLSWPQPRPVSCVAALGQVEWSCRYAD